MMNRSLLALLFAPLLFSGCDALFGTKQDETTDEIFREGRRDPNLVTEDVGFAALTPFWTGFNQPTDVFVGYDELVYVTDADGVHVLDRAGRRYRSHPLRGAVSVTMDRKLNLYVAARYDTIIASLNPSLTWDLSAVYKLRGLNQDGPVQVVDILVQPFLDNSRSTTSAQRARLIKGSPISEELVELTGVAVLADNSIYVSRRGPSNPTGTPQAADNTILWFTERMVAGVRTGKMENVSQIRSLSPTTPSLLSAVGMNTVTSFIAPPQRDNMSADMNFLVAQGDQTANIPYRLLWINVVETVNGTEYQPRVSLLARDTTKATRFMYDQNRFTNPKDIAFSADGRNFIYVVDSVRDSLYLFQSNGLEGVNPPVGSTSTKTLLVSFGGTGNGPRQFDEPSGVAYFRQVVYVADKKNNRIARYKLNTDLE